ncbi:uncharacterized protein IWZ02DRAFT_204806 [Phyllosticta citriasiana]|uniref:uncharacterized protein n=1 Tax=Phyllosticta citriasiana TaxID=595635 RepID=UPI0030FD2958
MLRQRLPRHNDFPVPKPVADRLLALILVETASICSAKLRCISIMDVSPSRYPTHGGWNIINNKATAPARRHAYDISLATSVTSVLTILRRTFSSSPASILNSYHADPSGCVLEWSQRHLNSLAKHDEQKKKKPLSQSLTFPLWKPPWYTKLKIQYTTDLRRQSIPAAASARIFGMPGRPLKLETI